jgi:hypothetical protein
MLWLEWQGGQLPIGWDKGPVATIESLFGTSWKLYEDVNRGNGMTVVRLLLGNVVSSIVEGSMGAQRGDLSRKYVLQEEWETGRLIPKRQTAQSPPRHALHRDLRRRSKGLVRGFSPSRKVHRRGVREYRQRWVSSLNPHFIIDAKRNG